MPERPAERRRRVDGLELDAVQRPEISDDSRQEFSDARAAGDLQGQIDVIWHVVSGDDPAGDSA